MSILFYKLGSSVRSCNGRFEIWSLNKILGTSCGAVIWCANKQDYDLLMEKKQSQNNFFLFLKPLIRFSKQVFPNIFLEMWENYEFLNSNLSTLDNAEISYEILNWNKKYEIRLRNINYFIKCYSKYMSKEELNLLNSNLRSGVLPSGILLSLSIPIDLIDKAIMLHRFYYNGQNRGSIKLKRVYFLPTYLI